MAGEIQQTQTTAESSIAKAREAQKKFEESKAKVEAAKAKADAAIKKAKELQQRIKETQAAFKAPRGVKGGIAAVAANQVGSLRGKLVAQVQKQVLSMLNKFSSGCPNSKELEKIIKTRSTLINHLTSFEKRVGKFAAIANQLTATVAVVSAIIEIITAIPIPTAIIPGQVGGIGIPISILTKYSNALVKLNKELDKLLGEAMAITEIIATVTPAITNLKNRLTSIDLAIQQCSIGQPADLGQILATAQPPSNTGSEGTPKDAQGNPDPDYLYKGYTLAIVQDPDSPKIAPRRFAIAMDRSGVMKLRGQSSFSSDTQVLLDELKFKIDNQFT
ncbi:hypothetical protein UFOVP54_85 [uncultured Caudovirales phage]|uniref:Uncharacterized protein n=1 Tax=uncultured Caudovirales phage TaxID=2100421 RepID=A0A6J5KV62_9CAUD|nr:hypothetical protein UFOVP54_85 [uncultured Caudovirales phage]